VFQSASEHAIFIQKIETFSPPRTHPHGAYGVSTLAPSALNLWPLSKILVKPLVDDYVIHA